MDLNRIRLCAEVDTRLIQLKGRTGLTPNLLCRLGFCLSLKEPTQANRADYKTDSPREFNRYTVTGKWDTMFIALLRERCHKDGLDTSTDLADQFIAHLNRGVLLLFQRVKHLGDITRLVEEAATTAAAQESDK